MDAGTSEPTLHQMQPVRPQPAPHHQMRPAGVPMRPPNRGPFRPGPPMQRPGMVRPGMPVNRQQVRPGMGARGPESALPPTMFRFRAVERNKIPGIPRPRSPVKYAPPPSLSKNLPPLPNPMSQLPRRHPPPTYNNRNHIRPPPPQTNRPLFNANPPPNRQAPPQPNRPAPPRAAPPPVSRPSTSYSEPVFKPPEKLTFETVEKKYPVLECVTEVYVSETGHVEKLGLDHDGNEVELPPNVKLFNYKCSVAGVERTLLIPMPLDAYEEDVQKMLPDSFRQFAQSIIDNSEQPVSYFRIPEETSYIGLDEPETSPDPDNAPFLVNPKQFVRITRRRMMRQRLEMQGRLPLQRQKYLHESRHLHAINRRRGQDGRFDQKFSVPSANEESSSGSTPNQRFAQPLSRPVTTYAEIRPNNTASTSSASSNLAPVYFGNRPSFRLMNDQPITSAPADLTPVTFGGPSTSTASTSSYNNYHHNEGVQSYNQYQDHVQYPELYSSEGATRQEESDVNAEPSVEHQQLTDL